MDFWLIVINSKIIFFCKYIFYFVNGCQGKTDNYYVVNNIHNNNMITTQLLYGRQEQRSLLATILATSMILAHLFRYIYIRVISGDY